MTISIPTEQYTLLKDTAVFMGVTVDWLVENQIIRPWLQDMEDMDEYARMMEEAENWTPAVQY